MKNRMRLTNAREVLQKIIRDKYIELGGWDKMESYFGLPKSTLRSVGWGKHDPRMDTAEIILRRAGLKLTVTKIFEEEKNG